MDLLDLDPQSNLFGWRPLRPWEEADERAADWYREWLEKVRPVNRYIH